HPDDERALFARGVTRARQGHFSSAISDFEQVDRVCSRGDNSAMLAYAMAQIGQPGPAHAYAWRAIEQGFKSAAIYEISGAALMESGGTRRFEEARRDLDTALRLDDKMQA